MGVILAAGGSLGWFRDKIIAVEADLIAAKGQDPFAALMDGAAAVPPGAEGLLFLPYLAGERSPHMDPHARGAWVGLSLAHDQRHLVRALVEGVGFAFTDCLERMRTLGFEPESVALTGGGAGSALWREILAAQLQRTADQRARPQTVRRWVLPSWRRLAPASMPTYPQP